MDKVAYAGAIYASIVTSIFFVAKLLDDVIKADTLEFISKNAQNKSLLAIKMQNSNTRARKVVDKIFKFKKFGPIYIPSVTRSISISIFLLIFIVIPTLFIKSHDGCLHHPDGSILENTSICLFPIGSGAVKDFNFYTALILLFIYGIIAIFVSICDFISFIKTRLMLGLLDRVISLKRRLWFPIADIFLSFILYHAIRALFIVALFAMFTSIITYDKAEDLKDLYYAIYAPRTYTMMIVSPISGAVYITTIFILIVSILVYTLEHISYTAYKVDGARVIIFQHLNFDKKPGLVSGIILISIITFFYWIAFSIYMLMITIGS